MAKSVDGRLAYADLLRVIALLGVIVIHVASEYLGAAPVGSFTWEVANVYDGLSRGCVPLFIMLSGMFMLEPKKGSGLVSLFLHNILRLVAALLVWGTVYALLDYGVVGGRLTWGGVRTALAQCLRGNTHYHLWFVYMIIGLYLVTPLLRAFVRGASRGDFRWGFFLTGLLVLTLPLLEQLRPNQVLARYRGMLELYLLMGYTCFYVAGYYLKHFTISRLSEALIYAAGVLGAVATVWGTSYLSRRAGSYVGILYNYTTINVALMAAAVFVLFRYVLGVSDERGRRRGVTAAARVSFGIYLCHELFLMLMRHFDVFSLAIPAAVAIPLWTLVVFAASFAVAWLLGSIPVVGRYLT